MPFSVMIGTCSGLYGTVAMWIVSPWLALMNGNMRSNAVNGMRKKLLFEPPMNPGLSSRTPTTMNLRPLNSTVLLSGSSVAKSVLRTSWPITATSVAYSTSGSVMKRP